MTQKKLLYSTKDCNKDNKNKLLQYGVSKYILDNLFWITFANILSIKKIEGLDPSLDNYEIQCEIPFNIYIQLYKLNFIKPYEHNRVPRCHYKNNAEKTEIIEDQSYYDHLVLSMFANTFVDSVYITYIKGEFKIANGQNRTTNAEIVYDGDYQFGPTIDEDSNHQLGISLNGRKISDFTDTENEKVKSWLEKFSIPCRIILPINNYGHEILADHIFRKTNSNLTPIQIRHSFPSENNQFAKSISSPFQLDCKGRFKDINDVKENFSPLLLNKKDYMFYKLLCYKEACEYLSWISESIFCNRGDKQITNFIKKDIHPVKIKLLRYFEKNLKEINTYVKKGSATNLSCFNYTLINNRLYIVLYRFLTEEYCVKIKDDEKFWTYVGSILGREDFYGWNRLYKENKSNFHEEMRNLTKPSVQKRQCNTIANIMAKDYNNGKDLGFVVRDKTRKINYEHQDNECFITGHKLIQADAGHIIAYDNGGITSNENIRSMERKINNEISNGVTSEYIREKLINGDKDFFTPTARDKWNNGRMEEVIKIENSPDMRVKFILDN